MEKESDKEIIDNVKNYYGKVLHTSKDLKTSACCVADKPHQVLIDSMKLVPKEIMKKFYGCGNPIPLGIEGLTVLDLGSGSGRDCYIAAKLVGPNGYVIGVDMTDEQLEVARKYVDEYTTQTLGYEKPNMEFKTGYIEFLDEAGVAADSIDIAISNCVVNLSPDKERVIAGVYKALRDGGEFYFSDVYCDRRLPEDVRKHEVLWGECIAGAMYTEDFRRICQKVGFLEPRVLSKKSIPIYDEELIDVLGDAKFYSITYRLFKVENLEDACEDYGQVAVYKGTIPGHKFAYVLDNNHRFVKNKPELVCGNTASMLGESWLKPHFQIIGDRNVHYGKFDCSVSTTTSPDSAEVGDIGGGSCCGGGCC